MQDRSNRRSDGEYNSWDNRAYRAKRNHIDYASRALAMIVGIVLFFFIFGNSNPSGFPLLFLIYIVVLLIGIYIVPVLLRKRIKRNPAAPQSQADQENPGEKQ